MASRRRQKTATRPEQAQASVTELVREVDAIKARIVAAEGAIRDAQEERDRLCELLEAKGGEVIRALGLKTETGAPSTSRRSPRRGSGAAAANAEKIVAYMKSEKLRNVGRRVLTAALRLNDAEASAALKRAVNNGLLTKEGERRGTIYNLVR